METPSDVSRVRIFLSFVLSFFHSFALNFLLLISVPSTYSSSISKFKRKKKHLPGATVTEFCICPPSSSVLVSEQWGAWIFTFGSRKAKKNLLGQNGTKFNVFLFLFSFYCNSIFNQTLSLSVFEMWSFRLLLIPSRGNVKNWSYEGRTVWTLFIYKVVIVVIILLFIYRDKLTANKQIRWRYRWIENDVFFQEDLWCYLKLLLFCCLLSVAPTNVACRKFTDDWSNSLTANYIDSCPVLSRCHLCTVCRNVCRVFFILQLLWIAHPWCNYFCLCFPGAVPRV